MASTQTGLVVVGTLNGAVARGTIIDNGSNGWTTNATNVTTNDGDVLVIVGKGGIEQKFSAKAQTATAVKIVPLIPVVATVDYPDKSPIYAVATKSAM